jgi:hypothetical protein
LEVVGRSCKNSNKQKKQKSTKIFQTQIK